MKILSKSITLILCLLFVVFFASPLVVNEISDTSQDSFFIHTAQAQDEPYQFLAPIGGLGEEAAGGGRQLDVSSEDSFPNYVQTMITIVIGFAIMTAIILIIASGFQYMTSDSQQKVSAAKEQISNAILGLVLALAAVLILNTINPNLVELNSVETVTTSGTTLNQDIDGPDDWEDTEYGGTVHYEGERSHGDKYCMFLDDTWAAIWEYDRYICYETSEKCEEGRQEADEAGEWGGVFSSVECNYYHQSTGVLIDSDTGVEYANLKGVGETAEKAIQSCEWSIQTVVIDRNIDECLTENGLQLDSSACEAVCGDAEEEPFASPDHLIDTVWCSANNPTGSDDSCQTSKLACEGNSNQGCYPHPVSMKERDGFGGEIGTNCADCTWLNTDAYSVRELPSVCSPENSDTEDNYCRIDADFSDEIEGVDIVYSGEYQITEAFPPLTEKTSTCYYNGTCVSIEIRKNGGPSGGGGNFTNQDLTEEHVEQVAIFMANVSGLGLDVEYRTGSSQLRNYLIENGEGTAIDEGNVSSIVHYGEPHFFVRQQ